MTEVLLTYARTGEHYSAQYFVDHELQHTCIGCTFEEVIVELSGYLKQAPDCRLTFRRTDNANLRDYVAPDEERDQIRDYPYIYAASKHDVVVVVRDQPMPEDRVRIQIRAGYDTLADAFGDNVYLRCRDDGCIECPCCGRWHARLEDETLTCRCTPKIASAKLCGSWVEVPTIDLIHGAKSTTRFYLPRAWNISGPWISRTALLTKLSVFIKEANDVRE